VFIKRNSSRQGGKTYRSVLLVEGVRVPQIQPRGRLRKDAEVKPRVVHRALANLSRLREPLVALIEQYCKGQVPTSKAPSVRMGSCYGVLGGLHALAGELGLVAALGPDRSAKHALFMIYARVAWQGSRLAAVRWAEDHAVAAVLSPELFDQEPAAVEYDGRRLKAAVLPKPKLGLKGKIRLTSRDGTCTLATKSPRNNVASALASIRSFLICASAMIRFFAGCDSTTRLTPGVSSSTS